MAVLEVLFDPQAGRLTMPLLGEASGLTPTEVNEALDWLVTQGAVKALRGGEPPYLFAALVLEASAKHLYHELRAEKGISEQRGAEGAEVKARVVFLAANPEGTNRLALDEEIREITAKVRASTHRERLEIHSHWAVRPDDLLQVLNEHRPQIVHFSSHGSCNDEIILCDRNGMPKPVALPALEELFRVLRGEIRVVILNACYSKSQAEAIVRHVDCAIGMRRSIGDVAAITFIASFYRSIGFGHSVKRAFEEGRTALLLEGIPEENTPELLTRRGVDPSKVVIVRSGQGPAQ